MKKNKTWLLSDLYLGQVNRADILKCWNDCVFDTDTVYLLGNIAASNKSYWYSQIQSLPGKKVLFLGVEETNRTPWYEKWGFTEIVPFNQTRLLHINSGKVMLSHLPVFISVVPAPMFEEGKYLGLINKFTREFNAASCVLNLHGFTGGKGMERNNTIDVSGDVLKGSIPTLEQLLEKTKN